MDDQCDLVGRILVEILCMYYTIANAFVLRVWWWWSTISLCLNILSFISKNIYIVDGKLVSWCFTHLLGNSIMHWLVGMWLHAAFPVDRQRIQQRLYFFFSLYNKKSWKLCCVLWLLLLAILAQVSRYTCYTTCCSSSNGSFLFFTGIGSNTTFSCRLKRRFKHCSCEYACILSSNGHHAFTHLWPSFVDWKKE